MAAAVTLPTAGAAQAASASQVPTVTSSTKATAVKAAKRALKTSYKFDTTQHWYRASCSDGNGSVNFGLKINKVYRTTIVKKQKSNGKWVTASTQRYLYGNAKIVGTNVTVSGSARHAEYGVSNGGKTMGAKWNTLQNRHISNRGTMTGIAKWELGNPASEFYYPDFRSCKATVGW